MRREKEVARKLVAVARELGVENPNIERRRKHPSLTGTFRGQTIKVTFGGTTRDTHAFEIARQYLRRQVMLCTIPYEEGTA